ncbi:hypothetical protein SAMN05192555_103167 [Franzmannia pantelleriensis]|uniref:Uncharacterized protein n=1 Tax=Franzmannia pantelleriensis TaxID=48727 RepID=A0A1G9IGI4_9GAMM|nr:hypothetical protein SAMN05192555_103167 [Halomonas pantelleriensis]
MALADSWEIFVNYPAIYPLARIFPNKGVMNIAT